MFNMFKAEKTWDDFSPQNKYPPVRSYYIDLIQALNNGLSSEGNYTIIENTK